MKKVVYIVIFFILALLCFSFDTYAFVKGDKVQAKEETFIYEYTVDSIGISHYKKTERSFAADTIFTYVKYIEDYDSGGLSEVTNNGKNYYVQESSLKIYDKNTNVQTAAREILDKYRGKSIPDMSDLELSVAYKECNSVMEDLNKGGAGGVIGDTAIKVQISIILEDIQAELEVRQISEEQALSMADEAGAETVTDKAEKLEEEQEQQQEQQSVLNGDTIYTNQPSKTGPSSAGGNLDDVMSDADQFVQSGNPTLSNTELQNFSNTVYNIALAVGVVVAVLVGAIIGIKLMASNIETKVEAKKLLIPYVVGCVVVFGGFAIWKIVVGILQGM